MEYIRVGPFVNQYESPMQAIMVLDDLVNLGYLTRGYKLEMPDGTLSNAIYTSVEDIPDNLDDCDLVSVITKPY